MELAAILYYKHEFFTAPGAVKPFNELSLHKQHLWKNIADLARGVVLAAIVEVK